jgi:hypothetical protein
MGNLLENLTPGEKHGLATTILVLLSAFDRGRISAERLNRLFVALNDGGRREAG